MSIREAASVLSGNVFLPITYSFALPQRAVKKTSFVDKGGRNQQSVAALILLSSHQTYWIEGLIQNNHIIFMGVTKRYWVLPYGPLLKSSSVLPPQSLMRWANARPALSALYSVSA